jgi:hypothetical protein
VRSEPGATGQPKASGEAPKHDEEPAPSYLLPVPPLAVTSLANRYAAMTPTECRVEAQRRGLPLTAVKRAVPGVSAPVRVTGRLNGIVMKLPDAKSPFGILDCRLALALDEMTKLLGTFAITELHIDNMYRPRARVAGKNAPSQHAFGLAIDVLSMTVHESKVVVETDWSGKLGTEPCGPETIVSSQRQETLTLRNAVCAITRRGLFHHVLTPNHNRDHEDHLHFDLEPGEKTLLLH